LRRSLRFLAVPLAAIALYACSSTRGPVPGAALPPAAPAAASLRVGRYIKHVVIVVQENRSFDSLFAGYPGADAPTAGYTHGGVRVPLKETTFDGPDINHEWAAAIADWDGGKMDGFDTTLAYGYVSPGLVAPYRRLASQYVLADRMFPTEFGTSFTAHLDLIASTANLSPQLAEVDQPDGDWRCNAAPGTRTDLVDSSRRYESLAGPFPCFTQFRTLAETLDDAGVAWKYYAPAAVDQLSWSAFATIKYVWDGPDWAQKVVSPQTRFLRDAAAGTLAGVTWVVPDFHDSDHTGSNSDTGPSWVAAVVNTIGRSPNWKSTAIVVLWDDWGGWYDDAPPPQKDFVGRGIRVPCLIISPYAKRGYVSHTQYEFGSVVRFVEQAFSLPPLGPASFGYTDSNSNSLVDAFDFTQKPRAYVSIPAKYPISHFLREKPSLRAPDDI
jgi:phospholipase C